MTVESDCVIAIATLSDWLSFSANEKQNQNQLRHVRVIFSRALSKFQIIARMM